MKYDDLLDVPTPTLKAIAKKHNVELEYLQAQLRAGIKVEKEHTTDVDIAKEIALDHLNEKPDYYERLKQVEEASYRGNIGMMEVAKFFQIATNVEKLMLKHLMDQGNSSKAWQLIQRVTGTKLQGAEFNESLNEGWKENLLNVAVAAGLAVTGTAALQGKKAYDDYTSANAEPVAKVQQVQQPQAKAPTTITKQAEPVKVAEPEPKDLLMTSHANEKILHDVAVKHGIEGDELAAFMSQMAHESADFTDMVENNPNIKRYSSGKTAKSLGNKSVNDAKRFIGRGFIQLTGRWNYTWMEKRLGIDLTSTWSAAHKAAEPKIAAEIAVVFWKERVRPNVSNFQDVKAVTKPINPKLNGLDDRIANFNSYMEIAML